jgi:hypothetical protein
MTKVRATRLYFKCWYAHYVHTKNSAHCSNSVLEPRTLISQLSNLLVTHTGDQMFFLALLTTRIDPMQREPQDRVTRNRKRNHGHGNCVALDKSRTFFGRIDLSTQLALSSIS